MSETLKSEAITAELISALNSQLSLGQGGEFPLTERIDALVAQEVEKALEEAVKVEMDLGGWFLTALEQLVASHGFTPDHPPTREQEHELTAMAVNSLRGKIAAAIRALKERR